MQSNNIRKIYKKFERLRRYCEMNDFKGYDPYDGLNSPFHKLFTFKRAHLLRLIWIQTFKKSPINFRPLFKIKREYNPKGIALFLTGYCNLFRKDKEKKYSEKIIYLAEILIKLQTKGFSGACWGYNFPWQTRMGLFPKKYPTVVTTSFASYALMDAYDCTGKQEYLDVALNSTNFILKDLKKTYFESGFMFSYTPLRRDCVYNATLLASRLLSRAYHYVKKDYLIESAEASVHACVEKQGENGSWAYGVLPFQNWVDSFHTGFNLECISEYQRYSNDYRFSHALEKALKYYVKMFFLKSGIPNYYDNKIYPIDIHSPAQFIVTLYRMKKIDMYREIYEKILKWTCIKMQDKRSGYFYYQKNKTYLNKIPYMRWSQAWMFYAISFYFLDKKNEY